MVVVVVVLGRSGRVDGVRDRRFLNFTEIFDVQRQSGIFYNFH